MMKELTLRTRDYLVSFGECMSTRVFAAYLNKIGVKARQVPVLSSSSAYYTEMDDVLYLNFVTYWRISRLLTV